MQLWKDNDLLVGLIRPMDDVATPWLGLIVGMPITGLYFWANNQTLVQRVLSSKAIDEGRKGVIFAGFLTLLTLFIIAIPGVIARYLFPGLDKPDMVYPNMVMQLIPTGLLGIMLAALLSALTSTLSAILNSTSTLFTMDFYSKFTPPSLVKTVGNRRQDNLVHHYYHSRLMGSTDRQVWFSAEVLSRNAFIHGTSYRCHLSFRHLLAPCKWPRSLFRTAGRIINWCLRIYLQAAAIWQSSLLAHRSVPLCR